MVLIEQRKEPVIKRKGGALRAWACCWTLFASLINPMLLKIKIKKLLVKVRALLAGFNKNAGRAELLILIERAKLAETCFS